MLKSLLTTCVLAMLATAVSAQETPKLELFGGYSYLRADDVSAGSNMNGWNASVSGNTNDWFGVTLDFSGHYRRIDDRPETQARVNTFMMAVGPRFAARGSERVTPFAHLMAGLGRSGYRAQTIAGRFDGVHYSYLLVAGGGVDLKLGDRLAYRLLQGDYVLTHFAGRFEHQFRVSTGLVLRNGTVR
ncbi:MAG: outer membrane beta-barrel protein [Acidobacteriota bacterium]